MDLKLIIITVMLAVAFNSLLLFGLFWYFFRRKAETRRGLVSADTKKPNPNKERDRFKVLIFLSAIILSAGIIYAFIFKHNVKNDLLALEKLNSAQELQAQQKTTTYRNPEETHPRGLNLIFFADRYPSWEEFDSDINSLMLGIGQIEPWKKYADYNIYKINPGTDSQLCRIKIEDERKPVLRCSAEINDFLETLRLKNFRLIVLSRQDFQSWANVTRLDNSGIFFSLKDKLEEGSSLATSYLLAHLLGHSFGLKDEEKFVIAKANGAPHTPDGPNCAPDKETAQAWWGELAKKYPERVGYFQTCAGSDEYIRPTQSSLMNFGDNMDRFIPDYGPVSEEYLRKILDYCFSEKAVTKEKDPAFFERYPELKQCLD